MCEKQSVTAAVTTTAVALRNNNAPSTISQPATDHVCVVKKSKSTQT